LDDGVEVRHRPAAARTGVEHTSKLATNVTRRWNVFEQIGGRKTGGEQPRLSLVNSGMRVRDHEIAERLVLSLSVRSRGKTLARFADSSLNHFRLRIGASGFGDSVFGELRRARFLKKR
jgi:hypothetical protein